MSRSCVKPGVLQGLVLHVPTHQRTLRCPDGPDRICSIVSSTVVSVAPATLGRRIPLVEKNPAKCPVPVLYNSSSFSTWTTHHGGKAAVEGPTPLKCSRLRIFRKVNDEYEKA